jgi:predicted metal-dependent phosphoesterase TrpH
MVTGVGSYSLDLHTHTYRSGDEKTSFAEYAKGAESIDLVALTDHHDIMAGLALRHTCGLDTIIGEEINTGQGEVIGLYLTLLIPRGLGLRETCRRIRAQGGLVCVPHPTDATRHGIGVERLADLCQHQLADIVEVGNSKSVAIDYQAEAIANHFNMPVVASSDAHVGEAIGSSFTTIARRPTGPQDLVSLLAGGRYHHRFADPIRDPTKTSVTPGSMGVQGYDRVSTGPSETVAQPTQRALDNTQTTPQQ